MLSYARKGRAKVAAVNAQCLRAPTTRGSAGVIKWSYHHQLSPLLLSINLPSGLTASPAPALRVYSWEGLYPAACGMFTPPTSISTPIPCSVNKPGYAVAFSLCFIWELNRQHTGDNARGILSHLLKWEPLSPGCLDGWEFACEQCRVSLRSLNSHSVVYNVSTPPTPCRPTSRTFGTTNRPVRCVGGVWFKNKHKPYTINDRTRWRSVPTSASGLQDVCSALEMTC